MKETKTPINIYKMTGKVLKPLSVLEAYKENFCISEVKNKFKETLTSTATRYLFPNDRVASIIWHEDIEKFTILPFDYDGFANTDLFREIKCDLETDESGFVLCENENEIIEALEIIRTAVKLTSLTSGDMFSAYVKNSDQDEWQTYMMGNNSEEMHDYIIVNLSVGTFWKLDDEYNDQQLKWVLKIDNPYLGD